MKALRIILLKEIRDNLRDRRSLFFSLVIGPVLMPMLIIGTLILTANKYGIDFEQPRDLEVVGAGHAPELMNYLETHSFDIVEAGDDYGQRIRAGELNVALEVSPAFARAFAAGDPAPLTIHHNSGEHESRTLKNRLKSVLDSYASRIGGLRYLARGIDQQVFEPLSIAERDLSEEGAQEAAISLMLPFILLMSMMLGGFYLAVDTTAGERERLSLEPLLALPVKRSTVVLGKYTATLTFVLAALILPLVISYILFGFLSDDSFTNIYDFSAGTFIVAGAINLPVAVMLTSLLLFIAAFARSTKEAQTLMGFTNMVPVLPFFLLQFVDVPQQLATFTIPLLSQFQIIERLITGVPVPPALYTASASGTLIVALLLLAATIQLYRRESILH